MKRILWLSGVLGVILILGAVLLATARRGDNPAPEHDAAPELADRLDGEQPALPAATAPTRAFASMHVSGRPTSWRDSPPDTTLVGGEDLSAGIHPAVNRPPSTDPFRLVSPNGIVPAPRTTPGGLANAQNDAAEPTTTQQGATSTPADGFLPRGLVVQAAAELPSADEMSSSAGAQTAPRATQSSQLGDSPAPAAGLSAPAVVDPRQPPVVSGPTIAGGQTGRTGAAHSSQTPGPSPKLAPVDSQDVGVPRLLPKQGDAEASQPGHRSIPKPAEVFDDAEPGRLLTDPQAIPAVATGSTAGWPPQQPPVIGGGTLDALAPGASQGGAGESQLDEGTGRPGAKQLEGPQTAQLTIQKIAPPEVQVGKPATFRITVRNSGAVAASGVEIRDPVPKGARVVGTNPPAQRGVHGELVFSVGTLKPGDEVSVEVQLMPLVEGEIGSVATVSFNADASGRTVATKPQLVLETVAPQSVLIGEQATIGIVISNPGTGVATNVVLYEQVPEGMYHPAGNELEYAVGQLRPGDQRRIELTLIAKQPGTVTNVLVAKADGNLQAEDRRTIEITAPRLELLVEGPKKRYLEREGTYQISIANPGSAPAEQVELAAVLPSGLKFVSANNNGHYDEANRTVHWRLQELPTGEKGTVELVTVPVEAGQQSVRLVATAQRGVRVEREHPVTIEGIAAVMFQVADTVDPIEVGGETTYEIRVVNQGSKAATNLRLAVLLPPELKPVAADGPTRNSLDGNNVIFDGLPRLAAKADTIYRVRVKGTAPGDLRTRIQLMTDDMAVPVTKEESTRVFAEE